MKLTIASALAAAGLTLAHPASAGITCNLTDTHGNALQYSFARGGHGYTNETSVKRNGLPLSNGGPMWTRSSNSAQRTMTLEQNGWMLVYEAKPNDTDVSQAALFAPGGAQKASGACIADYSIDGPPPAFSPAPVAPTYNPPPAPAPTYTAQAPSAGGPDAVGIVSVNGKGALVQVMLGSHQEAMLIDTGATSVLVNPTLAETLVNSGEADWGAPSMTEIADGSSVSERTITIHQMRIGRHVLYNVSAWVNAKETIMLLGFPVLNQMGRFTVDTTSNLLIFG